MKKLLLTICLVLSGIGALAQPLYVGEFNIRNANKKDAAAGNGWERRCPVVCDIIRVESFDIFGSQEVLHSQLEDMLKALPQYAYVGAGRNDGKTKGEYAPIFYRTDRIKCLSDGMFWLSQTPEVVGSLGWDAKYTRICTWGRFKDMKTGKKFWMFNLHMDHRGVEARKQSCYLVIERIKQMCGKEPYILLGDFNVDQKNEIYTVLSGSGILKDTYDDAQVRFAETGSMNFFKPDYWTDCRIDHVFVSPKVKTLDYSVLTYCYWVPVEMTDQIKADLEAGKEGVVQHEKRLPSDHYPVGVHMILK